MQNLGCLSPHYRNGLTFFRWLFTNTKSTMLPSFSFIEADLTACVFHTSFLNSKKNWKAASNMIKHSSDPTNTKHDFLACMFELCHNLMLSVASNTSKTLGSKFSMDNIDHRVCCLQLAVIFSLVLSQEDHILSTISIEFF